MFYSKDFVLFALGFSLPVWFEGRDPEVRTFQWEVGSSADTEDNSPDPSQAPVVNQTKGSRYLVLTSFKGLQLICPLVISGQVRCEKSGILSTLQQINGEPESNSDSTLILDTLGLYVCSQRWEDPGQDF